MSKQLTHENFDHFYLSDGMLKTLGAVSYRVPTPVQAATIPLVMAGIDLIVQSQTGTGKTAAFAIPITEMLSHNPGTIEVLVLAPTRELAKQVSDEFARFCQFKDIDVATIYGGTGYEAQHKALETAQVVVATPGRLLDLANRGHCDLSNLRIFGLDEADEMLSMGFAEEVDAIIAKLPEERQSLLFSATITEDVKALGKSMLYYPEFVTLSSDSVTTTNVTHEFFRVSGVGRQRDLLRVLELEEPENAIIFANTKSDTFAVTKFLKRHGKRAEVLNGDLPQKERERTLKMLGKGEIDFLVATDVAARGIDISELSHVINYVVPDSAEVYVHRTGRTGRAGLRGIALSLISPREMATLFNIRKLYTLELTERPLPTAAQIVEAKRQRRLDALNTALSGAQLPYGGSLGLAQQLVDDGDNKDNLKLLARLITLASKMTAGQLDDVDLQAAAPAAEVEEIEEIKEVEDVQEAVEATTEEVKDEAPKSERREKRARRDDKREEKREEKREAKPSRDESSADEQTDGEKPTRRRRRRRRDSETSDEAAAPAKASSGDEAKESAKTSKSDDDGEGSRRNSRSRRSRRSRSDREERGDRGGKESKAKPEDDKKPRDSGRSRNGRKSSRDDDKPRSKPQPEVVTDMSKIWVSVGRNHVEAAEQVVEMVCFMAGMDPDDLGSVTLENSYSYVEVREDYFYDIITAMNNQDWNGITVSAEPARK